MSKREYSYSFTTLRYVHDITTREFLNVGVAMHAPEAKFVGALFRTTYARLKGTFPEMDGGGFRSLMALLQSRFNDFSKTLSEELPLNGTPKSVTELASRVLPRDDSSLQWSEPGAGLTTDTNAELRNLFKRMVMSFEEPKKHTTRDDGMVWSRFHKPLTMKGVSSHLKPRKIVAKDFEYEFKHVWNNKIPHALEPVSFDLADRDSILDKASKWLGRATALADSSQKFELVFLLGAPRVDRLKGAYTKAENLLTKIHVKKELIREDDADKFATEMARRIKEHS